MGTDFEGELSFASHYSEKILNVEYQVEHMRHKDDASMFLYITLIWIYNN